MRKIIVCLFFFVVCSFSLIGQNETDTLPKVSYYVFVDSTKIEMSNKQYKKLKIDVRWIESIKLSEDRSNERPKHYAERFPPRIVIIYIKQEYNQKVLDKIKNN